MKDGHRDGCQCHGCVCARYELEIHSLTNDIEHERKQNAKLREALEHCLADGDFDTDDARVSFKQGIEALAEGEEK